MTHPITRCVVMVAAALLVAGCAPPRTLSVAVEPALAGKRAESRQAMVVTSATDASLAGLAMLEQGGNAIDAAVAASFALAVVDPSQTGLGGYAVGVAWFAHERRAEVMEAMAMTGADPAWGTVDPEPSGPQPTVEGGDARQPRSALVPGFVAGLLAWHEQRGRLPRDVVLAPAIRLAREGFIVGPLNHRLFAASRDKLLADPQAAALFMPGGEPVRVGERLVQPQLAAVLEAIARDGAAAFYQGAIAERMASKTRQLGGMLDVTDFAAYQPAMRRPTCSMFQRFTVLNAPTPVAGPALAQLLNMAEAGGLTQRGDPTHDPEAAVRLADAVRVSVADRALVRGHPDWSPGPIRGVSSAAFARARVSLIGAPVRDTLPFEDAWRFEQEPLSPACAALDPYPRSTARSASPGGAGDTFDAHALDVDAFDVHALDAGALDPDAASQTSHLVVIDAERNAVSLTSSVGLLFGSGVFSDGVFLNSSGGLFARGQRAPNRRPGSAILPTLLLEGDRVRLVAGAGGAAYIPTAVGQVVLRIAGWGQDPWAALAAPRLQPSAVGRALEIEQGFALPVYGALRAHGYAATNRVATLQFAGVHAAWVRDDGTIVGAADPRRDGVAVGK